MESTQPLNDDELTFEQFLVYSARLGETADVQEMLDVTDPPVDINYRDDTMNFNTALHMASANGHVQVVKMLLGVQGINVSPVNDTGNTPLHYASLNGKREVVELLIAHKADPNVRNDVGRIALEDALQTGHSDIAELLAPLSKLDDDKLYS